MGEDIHRPFLLNSNRQGDSSVASTPEKEIGIWRESKASLGFWLRAIFTLGIWVALFFNYNYIALTTRRITLVKGNFLTRNETSLSVESVTDINVNQSALGSIFNYGDIIIQTAGSGDSEIKFVRVEHPNKLREAVFDLRDGRLDETKL
jgi:uncharacterized membrane protein YdbT with pleckstrin-like domain